MPSFDIPESGLTLGSFPEASSKASAVPDVLGLTLTDAVIEEMIKCVQNGKGLQLSLGEHPSISYGSKVQNLATSYDPFSHDIFRSTIHDDSDSSSNGDMSPPIPNPKKGITMVQDKINHGFLAAFGGAKKNMAKFTELKAIGKPTTVTAKPIAKAPSTSSTTGTDDALAQLQGALASEQMKKKANTTQVIDSLQVPRTSKGQKVTNKSKFLSQNNRSLASGTTRSMPSSPALNGVASPSHGPTSVPLSQQNAEKAKAARKPIIHLLAVEPLAEKNLREKLSEVPENEFKVTLQKVGDLNETTGKWELRKSYWKELDVWTYKYDSSEERQRAIDNAVKQYDKMRLGISEPEWDRLLVKSERGTGKSLSKLQAEIAAKGSLAKPSKSNGQNAEGSGRDTPTGEDDLFDDKTLSKVKGENMARSASQPPTTKTKKVSEKEAQAKRLFSKNPAKAAPVKAAPKATSKPASAKKPGPAPKAGTKVLSSEYVEDSDDDEPAPPPPPPPKTTKPKPKPVAKRSREEDDHDTSDSSIPLSKKVRKEVPATTSNHRISDASQTSRTTQSSYSSFTSAKNKSNSPQKSSPLASSPPTNASDIDNSSSDRTSSSASPAPRFSTKNSHSPIHKRHQKSSSITSSSSGSGRISEKALNMAARFKAYYPSYVKLFEEVAKEGDNRTRSKERDLLDMHERLEKLRKDIEDLVRSESC